MKTIRLTLALTAFLSLGALSGCGTGEASVVNNDELEAAMPVPVEVTSPFRADIYATYRVTATVFSDSDAPAIARVGGQVVELLVEEGDRVERGQVLARLDGERLRLEMLSARANLEQARKEYERNLDLHERGLISAAMFEGLKFDLDALRATYELRKLNYDYSRIRAPIAGIVATRDVKPGQNLVASTVAFRITDTSELQAELQIPQSELVKFEAGHPAVLTVDSMPDSEFPASIARISPTIDVRNGTFRATAVIDNRAGHLAPGMFARFSIAYEKHEDALLVPTDAVVLEDEQASVFVVVDGEVTRRIVTTGISAEGRVEILDGLDGSEIVVVEGHSGLKSGSKVLASTRKRDSFAG